MSYHLPAAVPVRVIHKYSFLNNILFVLGALLMCLPSTAAQAQAQAAPPVARVLDAKGAAMVERSGQPPRLLGSGESLGERDVINVARDSWAILEFNDQSRITLRPNTVFRLDSYKADAPESMLLGLVKGGLRVVTGLFGKRNPDGVKFQTAVATIGIRGTEFDARLCDADCAAEERALPGVTAYAREVVARVVEMNGVAAAAVPGASSRLLVAGAALYENDGIATGPGSHAVLVFRDGARVTLEGNSRLAINRFRYRESAPADGSAYLTLYAGQAHVWTGRLAKISPDAFLVRSAMGVIRPHGTGFSVSGCIGSACGSVSGNVSSSGASGSASGSAGNASASASGSADSGGATGSATASDGSRTVSTGGSIGATPITSTAGTPGAKQEANRIGGAIVGAAVGAYAGADVGAKAGNETATGDAKSRGATNNQTTLAGSIGSVVGGIAGAAEGAKAGAGAGVTTGAAGGSVSDAAMVGGKAGAQASRQAGTQAAQTSAEGLNTAGGAIIGGIGGAATGMNTGAIAGGRATRNDATSRGATGNQTEAATLVGVVVGGAAGAVTGAKAGAEAGAATGAAGGNDFDAALAGAEAGAQASRQAGTQAGQTSADGLNTAGGAILGGVVGAMVGADVGAKAGNEAATGDAKTRGTTNNQTTLAGSIGSVVGGIAGAAEGAKAGAEAGAATGAAGGNDFDAGFAGGRAGAQASRQAVSQAAPPPPLPGGGNVAPLPSPPGGGSKPPPPPPASDVVDKAKDAGQTAATNAQNTANTVATNTQNTVDTVMQGAQDVVNFVSNEMQNQANAATQKAGQLGQAAQNAFSNATQVVIAQVQETFTQGAQTAGQQAANAGAALNAAGAAASSGANQVADAAVQQAVNVLNTATAPLLAEMTALMTQLRNNPPQTEAAVQQILSSIQSLGAQIQSVMSPLGTAVVNVHQSQAYMTAVGLANSQVLALYAAMSVILPHDPYGPLLSFRGAYLAMLETFKKDEYSRETIALAGLSEGDINRLQSLGFSPLSAPFIQGEVGAKLASDGSTAMKSLASETVAFANWAGQNLAGDAAGVVTDMSRRAAEVKATADSKAASGRTLADAARERIAPPGPVTVPAAAPLSYKWDMRPPRRDGNKITQRPNVEVTVDGQKHSVWAEFDLNLDTGVFSWNSSGSSSDTPAAAPLSYKWDMRPPRRDGNKITQRPNVEVTVDGQKHSVWAEFDLNLDTGVFSWNSSGSRPSSDSGNESPAEYSSGGHDNLLVMDGEVEVVGRGRVRSGEMLASAGGPVRVKNLPAIQDTKVDPNLFGGDRKAIDEGLYVWVRDGAVQLAKDGQAVDVSAGNAAVATKDKIQLLDTVPNFMRFDGTPRPLPGGSGGVIDTFRAGDGSILNMCSIR